MAKGKKERKKDFNIKISDSLFRRHFDKGGGGERESLKWRNSR